MNDEHLSKGSVEGTKCRPGKHTGFSAAPAVDPTVVCVHVNKHHIRDLAQV